MFHLCNVLQLVIYRFYYCSFPEQKLVRHAHQATFHVVFKFGDKLYTIHKQALEKVLADIPFVTDQFAIYEFYEGFVFQWFPVIHISWGYHKVQQLTPLVTYQMQLEAKDKEISRLNTILEKAFNWFPLLKEMLRMERLCYAIGFTKDMINSLLTKKEAIRCSGKIYSEEHRRRFEIKNDIFTVEKSSVDDNKLVLTINR